MFDFCSHQSIRREKKQKTKKEKKKTHAPLNSSLIPLSLSLSLPQFLTIVNTRTSQLMTENPSLPLSCEGSVCHQSNA